MMITISDELLKIIPFFHIIAYTMEVANQKTMEVENLIKELKTSYQLEDVCSIPLIKCARDAYKALGKDPSHTRVAAEALIRRVIKGNLEPLGDLIDLGNYLSVILERSVCVVDLGKLKGDVRIDIGASGEVVEAIGRLPINATNLITYRDEEGIFGSPTSDSVRTMITKETKQILIMLICFDNEDTNPLREQIINIYQKYANAKEIKKVL